MLRLSMAAANLLVEEFPLAEQCLVQEDESHWLLTTQVCRLEGPARFVMGLIEEVEVINSPEFNVFLEEKVKIAVNRVKV